MAQGPEEPKHWEGSVSAELPHATADEAWLLASDFFSIHKWLPGVETCHKVDGAEGIVRRCAGPAAEDGNPNHWAMERLLEINELEHSYSYEITESNMGFGRYVARMKVVPASSGEHGCKLTWSFEADPVQGWTQIGLLAYLQTSLETMARRIEEALTSTE